MAKWKHCLKKNICHALEYFHLFYCIYAKKIKKDHNPKKEAHKQFKLTIKKNVLYVVLLKMKQAMQTTQNA